MVVQTAAAVSNSVPSQVPLVLVVDDDDDSLTLMAYILEQFSCQACFVADGWAALAAAQQQRPSLILSDIHLPDMDGYSLLLQLRANGDTQSIPVVAVTALAGGDNRHKILAAGFDDYISKPFLVESVEQLIGRFMSLEQPAC